MLSCHSGARQHFPKSAKADLGGASPESIDTRGEDVLGLHPGEPLYIGVTNDLIRRVYQHKNKLIKGFTQKYSVVRLVWFETYDDITAAIDREKELKKWRREWKINLIEQDNPNWDDRYDDHTIGSRLWIPGSPLRGAPE